MIDYSNKKNIQKEIINSYSIIEKNNKINISGFNQSNNTEGLNKNYIFPVNQKNKELLKNDSKEKLDKNLYQLYDNHDVKHQMNLNSNIPDKYPDLESNIIDDTFQIMNNQTLRNNLLNSNITNSNKDMQTAKSSALRALLDEMKTKNFINVNNEINTYGNNSKNILSRGENLNMNEPSLNIIDNNCNSDFDMNKTDRINNYMINENSKYNIIN